MERFIKNNKTVVNIFLNIAFVLSTSLAIGQSASDLAFNFFNPSTRLYVIGENHFEEDGDLQIALIKYLESKTEINTVVIELSPEIAMLFNEYILNGTREADAKEICSLLNETAGRKVKNLINHLRNYNIENDKKIQIRGVNRYLFANLKRQMRGLKILFPELKNSKLPLASHYINLQKVKNMNSRKSQELIRSLISEATTNEVEYRTLLNDRYESYAQHLKDLEFHFADESFFNRRKADSIREVILSNNLMEVMDSNQVSLMICGANHAMKKEYDDFPLGYPITSMVANASIKYPSQVFSIVTQYYRKKILKNTWEFNLLEVPMKNYVVDNASKYFVLDEQELENHPYAKERCDMIIIQNKHFKEKKKKNQH